MIRLLLSLCLLLPIAAMAQPVEEPLGFRLEAYRAPVPETLEGATVIDVAAAQQIWTEGGTAFVDVLPRPPKPKNLPEGTVWREKPRLSIPGSTWLPNVGYGEIAEQTEIYFRDGLAAVTDQQLDHPVVLFCLAECWMSWNAAKRAVEYGYTQVYWFPQGTDAWAAAELPLEELTPHPEN